MGTNLLGSVGVIHLHQYTKCRQVQTVAHRGQCGGQPEGSSGFPGCHAVQLQQAQVGLILLFTSILCGMRFTYIPLNTVTRSGDIGFF